MSFIEGEPAADVLPTAVLHKYLNDELKILCLLQFLLEVAQNSLSFPCSEKSLSIPGLWPPCLIFSAPVNSSVVNFCTASMR